MPPEQYSWYQCPNLAHTTSTFISCTQSYLLNCLYSAVLWCVSFRFLYQCFRARARHKKVGTRQIIANGVEAKQSVVIYLCFLLNYRTPFNVFVWSLLSPLVVKIWNINFCRNGEQPTSPNLNRVWKSQLLESYLAWTGFYSVIMSSRYTIHLTCILTLSKWIAESCSCPDILPSVCASYQQLLKTEMPQLNMDQLRYNADPNQKN